MRVAVLIPCYNEQASIESVVRSFLDSLPGSTVYVYDNNSTDRTAEAAAAAGAVVRRESRKGKGNVIQRMFADVDADVYVLVDGDDTYNAEDAPGMVQKLCEEQLDVVNGMRVASNDSAYRPGHRFGNSFLSWLVSVIFGGKIADMMSGFKVFSRRFVKTFASPASGFEIDTALVVHALTLGMPVAEVHTPYKERPPGSSSKLNTFRDGWIILWSIFRLLLEERAAYLFGVLTIISVGVAVYLGKQGALDFLSSGSFERSPGLMLAVRFLTLAFLSAAFGLILELIFLARREAKRLQYLSLSPPPSR